MGVGIGGTGKNGSRDRWNYRLGEISGRRMGDM
jgi:hypothetical protein